MAHQSALKKRLIVYHDAWRRTGVSTTLTPVRSFREALISRGCRPLPAKDACLLTLKNSAVYMYPNIDSKSKYVVPTVGLRS